MYELMAFVWIIGWLYTCGKFSYAKDKVKKHDSEFLRKRDVPLPAAYAILFLFWPHYLGYGD